MKTVKQLLLFFFGGAPVGIAIGSALAPKFVEIGTGNEGALCNCRELAGQVADTYLRFQLGGLVLGGIAGLAVWVILRRKGKLQ